MVRYRFNGSRIGAAKSLYFHRNINNEIDYRIDGIKKQKEKDGDNHPNSRRSRGL